MPSRTESLKRKAADLDPPPAKRVPLTEFALIYSHPPWQGEKYDQEPFTEKIFDALSGYVPLKSGLTPLDPGPFSTQDEWDNYQKLEAFQKRRFRTFTIDELNKMEAFAPLSQIVQDHDVDLSNVSLHSAFAKDKWNYDRYKHTAAQPLGRGRDGEWEASNPVVWDLMLPALKVCSLILTNAHTWAWFDALIAGDYKSIDPSELPPGSDNIHKFSRRHPHEAGTYDTRSEIQDEFKEHMDTIVWTLNSTFVDVITSREEIKPACGNTYYGRLPEKTTIMVCYEPLETLLDHRITAAERMLCYFQFAVTAIHEFGHALALRVYREPCSPVDTKFKGEPYFEEDCVAEIGFSMENAVFGGLSDMLSDRTSMGTPQVGVMQYQWNTVGVVPLCIQPVLASKPLMWNWEFLYPVPLHYFFNLQDRNFWDIYVKKNGSKSTHMGPKVLGAMYDNSETIPSRSRIESLYELQYRFPQEMQFIDPGMMSADEVAARKFENVRRQQANDIFNALHHRQSELLKWQNAQKIKDAKKPDDPDDGPKPGSTPSQDKSNIPYYRPKKLTAQRYEEIKQYLIDFREDLAIDSMDPELELREEVFWMYILKQGNFELGIDEWRAFLISCQEEHKTLFNWQEVGYPPAGSRGFLRRIDAGWPAVTSGASTPETPPKKPSNIATGWYLDAVEIARISYREMNIELPFDLDKKLFYDKLLQTKTEITTKEGLQANYIPPPAMVERLVNWVANEPAYEKAGHHIWAQGPKGCGVYRKLHRTPPYSSPPDTPTGSASPTASDKSYDSDDYA